MARRKISTFLGRVDNKGHLVLMHPDQYQAWLWSLRNRDIEVTVGQQWERRTLEQNTWLHAVAYKLYADEQGEGHDDESVSRVKRAWLEMCFGTEHDPILNRQVARYVHTSELSKDQFAEFELWLQKFFAEFYGIDLPGRTDPRAPDVAAE